MASLAASAMPALNLAPVPWLLEPSAGTMLPAATVAMFLNSGGDERIWIDPLTGRTKYGTPASPVRDEIWFSSSSASGVYPQSFAAAAGVLERLVSADGDHDPGITSWLDRLRGRLVALFGIPATEAVLTGSGIEAEFIALSLAQTLLARPVTNIVIGPDEAASGVMMAAGGRHFLSSSSLAGPVVRGSALKGFGAGRIEVRGVALRDASGYPRDQAAIDREAAALVAQSLTAGRDVLLHVLDASVTGLSGVTRETAQALAAQARGRIAIVVDACQLRCPPERLREDLAAGFMVMITGSKFAGGPPFAGALLLPPAMVARLQGEARAPCGLSAYSARFDWPLSLRAGFAGELDQPINLGLGLRWEAALAVIEPYLALPEGLRTQVLTWFAGAVHRRVASRPHLRQMPAEPSRAKTIIPIETLADAGKPAGISALHAALAAARAPKGAASQFARACHLGQPVAIGEKMALGLSSSMPLVLSIAARIKEGQRIEAAVAPVVEDLDLLFGKWDRLAGA